MDLQLDPRSQEIIERQLRSGRYQSPEQVVASALEVLAEKEPAESAGEERFQAIRTMMDFADRHGFTLGDGLTIRELIHEGRKH